MDHLRPIHRLRSLCFLFSLFTASDATSSGLSVPAAAAAMASKLPRSLAVKHLGIYSTYPNTHNYYYMDSPISLPPYEDVMGPSSSPEDNSPTCLYPPLPPSPVIPTTIQSPPPPPSTSTSPPIIIPNPPTFSTPTTPAVYFPFPSPPETAPPPSTSTSPPIIIPNPPTFSTPTSPSVYFPSPPEYYEPTPPTYTSPPTFGPGPPMSPPEYYEPTPPISISPTPIFIPGPPISPPQYYEPTPPIYTSPPTFVPGPPMFEPPVVYPPPTVLAPPYVGTGPGMWCVAKPTVPDPIIEEAMNYACDSGADCNSIQSNGKCFQPNTMIAHASFAFNSYWQRTRVNGGTCDFGGTAMLVTKDPSYDGCHFSRQ